MTGIELSALELEPANLLRRNSPRPADAQPPDYAEKFDSLTVFYDCFVSADGEWVLFVGPPLFNLKSAVLPLVKSAFHHKFWHRSWRYRQDRCDLLWLRTSKKQVELPPGVFRQRRLEARPNHSVMFDRRKVLLTMSKDNELIWIRDWVEFHVKKHGCDAVLFYDNGSTKYSGGEVHAMIQSAGVEACVVVNWPYKFGPQGWSGEHWDSDFSQYAMLEHARHRFLGLAASVVNADVDELLITKNQESIHDLVWRSRTGYLRYTGQWIDNVASTDGEPRRHAQYFVRSKQAARVADGKWAIDPRRTHCARQWKVHEVTGARSDIALADAVTFRHFRSINTNWKSQRWKPEDFDPVRHEVDEELQAWLNIFSSDVGRASA